MANQHYDTVTRGCRGHESRPTVGRFSIFKVVTLCLVGVLALQWLGPLTTHLPTSAKPRLRHVAFQPLSIVVSSSRGGLGAHAKMFTPSDDLMDGAGADGWEDLGIRLAAPAERSLLGQGPDVEPPPLTQTLAPAQARVMDKVLHEEDASSGEVQHTVATTTTDELRAHGGASFTAVEIAETDWVFFVRMQKTGSETLWKALLVNWNGGLWRRGRRCSKGIFCGYRCEEAVAQFIDRFERGAENCKLLVRGHIGVHDFEQAARSRGLQQQAGASLVYLTMLRDPVRRVLSEFVHVTKNLPADFGPDAYGKAWDYNYTGSPDLKAYLDCESCRVGSSNRQARMLAGMFPTGADEAIDEKDLLDRASKNLEALPFFGITERYTDSMLMLKRTFPGPLDRFRRYVYSKHKYDGFASHVSGLTTEVVEQIRRANAVDITLYERALELFASRWGDMLQQTPESARRERFVGTGGGLFQLVTVVEPQEWVRPPDVTADVGMGKVPVNEELQTEQAGGREGGTKKKDVVEGEKQVRRDEDGSARTQGERAGGASKPPSRDGGGPRISRYEEWARATAAAMEHLKGATRAKKDGNVPKTIEGFARFREVVDSEALPRCRATRMVLPEEFMRSGTNVDVVAAEVVQRLEDVSVSSSRQLCRSRGDCSGFIYDNKSKAATLLHTTIAGAALQVMPSERMYMLKEERQQKDELTQLLERHRSTSLIQVASSRDTQDEVLTAANGNVRCRVRLGSPLPNEAMGYDVFEPVGIMSYYEVYAILDSVGPTEAMEVCAAQQRCTGFAQVVRHGHAHLFTMQHNGTVNLQIAEPWGRGGSALYSVYLKVAADIRRRTPAPIIPETEYPRSDYAFQTVSETKLLDAPRMPKPAGVVVTLTTIPSRINQIRATLLSLTQHQTQLPDKVLLAVPRMSEREGKLYDIPQWVREMPLVEVLETDDYGPATKLIAAVKHLKSIASNHLVIVVDDDTHYPPRLVETLLRWHELLPDAALAHRGWAVHNKIAYIQLRASYLVFGNELFAPHPVSVITANCGYLVQTAQFNEQLWNYTDVPDGARWMDDVWISGHLARNGVPRLVVPFDDEQFTFNSYHSNLTLDQIKVRADSRYNRYRGTRPRTVANNQALAYFESDWDVLWDRTAYRVYSAQLGIKPASERGKYTGSGGKDVSREDLVDPLASQEDRNGLSRASLRIASRKQPAVVDGRRASRSAG